MDRAQEKDDGVYTGPDNRNLSPKGKAITIKSENGPAACVLDCQSAGRESVLMPIVFTPRDR